MSQQAGQASPEHYQRVINRLSNEIAKKTVENASLLELFTEREMESKVKDARIAELEKQLADGDPVKEQPTKK